MFETGNTADVTRLGEQVGNLRVLREYHDVLFRLMGLVTDFVSPEGRIPRLSSADSRRRPDSREYASMAVVLPPATRHGGLVFAGQVRYSSLVS